MKKLDICETKNMYGGGFRIGIAALIGAGISFVIGAFDGLIKLKWQDLKNIVFIRNLSEKPLIQIRKKDSIMFIKSLDLMLIWLLSNVNYSFFMEEETWVIK